MWFKLVIIIILLLIIIIIIIIFIIFIILLFSLLCLNAYHRIKTEISKKHKDLFKSICTDN